MTTARKNRWSASTFEERFWLRVALIPDLLSCWIWTGYVNNWGYGLYGGTGAHRIAYELTNGPIPHGLEIDHLCRNKMCVRPSHLEVVTHQENQRRGIKGALTTHCPQGHPYNEKNTHYEIDARGYRHRKCRRCVSLKSVIRRRGRKQKAQVQP